MGKVKMPLLEAATIRFTEVCVALFTCNKLDLAIILYPSYETEISQIVFQEQIHYLLPELIMKTTLKITPQCVTPSLR